VDNGNVIPPTYTQDFSAIFDELCIREIRIFSEEELLHINHQQSGVAHLLVPFLIVLRLIAALKVLRLIAALKT
jgi:hypothetical protein